MKKVNIYDFDNTIYKGDSSTDFFFYSLMHYPKIIKYIPKIIFSFIKYKLGKISLTALKEVNFSFLNSIANVDELVNSFWLEHSIYIKDFYLQKEHNIDIIISASPEFLLKPICEKLNVYGLIASIVDKKTGKFEGLNCHDEEKVKRLKKAYPNIKVNEAMSDSKSDIPMLKLAKQSYYIKGNKIYPTDF